MSGYNKYIYTSNINNVEHLNKKVYINPNFNRAQTNNNLPTNPVMHVNPNFSHLVSNVQSNTQNKSKIFVNPNFIKPKLSENPSLQTSLNVNSISTSDLVNHHQTSENVVTSQVTVSKSRYCLVRQNEPRVKINEPVSEKANTFKLSRYKSVPWNDIKRNLDTKTVTNNISKARPPGETNLRVNQKYKCLTIPSGSRNKFKLVNYSAIPLVKPSRNKTKCIDAKRVLKSSPQITQIRLKKVKGNLKKNNIPCPLFRKFGKCLRNDRGTCEFLHDKKHVSICRKFIKGLCHDKECLLSHDLTTKKMPTCYFYLQGTCTKTDCPYLHVKLSEKTKVCQDFLKGYCEKGSKCLQRHVNVLPVKKNKQITATMSIKNKCNDRVRAKVLIPASKYNRQTEDNLKTVKTGSETDNKDSVKSESNLEHRYYQEQQNENGEQCEVIKPVRCKLGILPSYIQL